MSRLPLDTLLWVAVLGFLAYRLWPQAAAALGVGSAGAAAPEFRLETLAGDTVSLRELRGRVVLVNFWATWCPPCRFEMPGFQNVYDARREDGFVVVGISTDRTGQGVVQAFVGDHRITYPVGMATRNVVRDFGAVRVLPTSFLIDQQGRIRHTVHGVFAEAALLRAVDRLITEADDFSSTTAVEEGK